MTNSIFYSHRIKRLPNDDHSKNASMAHVFENIFIGNYDAPFYLDRLNKNNITRILNLSDINYIYDIECNIKVTELPMDDLGIMNVKDLKQILNRVKTNFEILKDLKPNENCLIHCSAGINRSALMIASYLICFRRLSYDQTLKLLTKANQKRNIGVLWNSGFRQILFLLYKFQGNFDLILKELDKDIYKGKNWVQDQKFIHI